MFQKPLICLTKAYPYFYFKSQETHDETMKFVKVNSANLTNDQTHNFMEHFNLKTEE